MKKKKISGIILILLVIAILAAGIVGAGFIRGWFDKPDDTSVMLHKETGICTLLREGVSYPVNSATILRAGDQICCQSGAIASIHSGNDRLCLGENATVTVCNPDALALSLQVDSGAVFAHCENGVTLTFRDETITVCKATALVSIAGDCPSVSVFRGTVGQAQAGQCIHYSADAAAVETLSLDSLSDFAITQIRQLKDAALCFTAEDLDRLAAQRQQQLQELLSSQTPSTSPTENTVPQSTAPTAPSVTPQQPTQPETSAPETSAPETTAPTQASTEPAAPAAAGQCSIAIYCTTILNNMGSLEPGKAEFVPGDGVILHPVTVDFYEGETVFDVMKRVCSTAGIQLEYSWTPMYDSYYVEGIHQLYEFDCGFESGWMYKVNGWFPNYGCSSYQLKDGDAIVWAYTCQGLGADLGARMP